jgi:polyisoprenyl-teichoic acid--peptidoglycan teichoic acid transferase
MLVVLLALAGGYYLWFSHLVHGANARVDPEVSAALSSPPSTGETGSSDTSGLGSAGSTGSSSAAQNSSTSVPSSPGTMDILLLGSDHRANVPGSRSDSIMLVHIDPKRGFASMLSLPRDLLVSIPGHGDNKLNAAYSYGGAALAIRTIKQVTGVNINHYLQVDFTAFQELTDSLGGVYIDVDRRYFNDDPTFEPINIQAGYQLLHGHDALEYVRFRHDANSDFGRMLRQQRFLQALKEQISGQGAGLLLKLPGLAGDLLNNAATDLSGDQILRLAYFGAKLSGGHIRQARLVGSVATVDGRSVVQATSAQIDKAVQDYLTPPKTGTTITTDESDSATETTIHSSGATANGASAVWKQVAATVPFAVEAPSYLPTDYKYFDRMPRAGKTYTIDTGSGKAPAIRIIYRYDTRDQYLGVSETSWLDAPLASPGTTVKSDGITYTVVGTSGKVDHVWWKKDDVLYWVSNSLNYLLSQQEMLKVAESFQPVAK